MNIEVTVDVSLVEAKDPLRALADVRIATGSGVIQIFRCAVFERCAQPQVPQLSLQIEEVDVSAITKKLSAKWSMESEQDLFAYHGMNAENELMTALGDEIAREIDRDIIDALFAFAGAGNVTWHSTVPSSGAYSLIDPKAHNRTLMDAITDANNLIFKQRYRNASFIVCGSNTAARLEKLDEFRLFPAADPVGTIVYGPHLFGTVSGRWTVYKDPWLDVTGPGGGVGGAETMLLGYKGTTALDTGYVDAPYIAMLTTAPFTNTRVHEFNGRLVRFIRRARQSQAVG